MRELNRYEVVSKAKKGILTTPEKQGSFFLSQRDK